MRTKGRSSLYGATFTKAQRTQRTDRQGYTVYEVTVTTAEGTERTVKTRGWMRDDVGACFRGDIVDVIRDGNGCAIAIKRGAERAAEMYNETEETP